MTCDQDNVKEEVVNYFKSLFKDDRRYGALGGIGEVIDNKVPLELAKMLVDKVSKEEIEKTLFSLPNIKALGPDSFGALFFMKAWNVVEEEVVEAIKDFFLSEELLKEINCTFIVLVLKCPNPSL